MHLKLSLSTTCNCGVLKFMKRKFYSLYREKNSIFGKIYPLDQERILLLNLYKTTIYLL